MDELGNTETTFFNHTEAPEEQVKEEQEQKGKVLEGIRLLEDIIARNEKMIAFYDSIDSIEVDPETHPEAHIRQLMANQQTKENLTKELEYLIGLRDTK